MTRTVTPLLILLAASPAMAAEPTVGFDAHNFHLFAADGQPVGSLQNATPHVTKGFFAGAVFEYAESPLVRVPASTDGTIDWSKASPVLDDVLAMNVNVGWAPIRYFRFDVGLPLFFASTGLEAAANGFTLGDARIQLTGAWSKEENRGFGVSLSPYVSIPTGGDAAFLGQSGIGAGGELAAGYRTDKLLASANVGYALLPDIALDNLSGADQITLGATLGYEVVDNLGLNAEVRAGLPLGENSWPGTETPAEVMLHGKYQMDMGLYFLAGGAGGISYGAGTPAYRVFAGLGFGPVFDATPKPPPPPLDLDADDDGINDDVDQCVNEPETKNEYKDADGCPDAIGALTATSTVNGKPVAGAIALSGGGQNLTGTGSVKVDRAEPDSQWTGKATYLCYEGEASAAAKAGDTALEIAMKPKLDSKAAVEVVNKKGKAVTDATIKFDTEASGGCVPQGIAPIADGKGTLDVGAGKHRVFVTAPDMTNYTGEFEFTPGQTTIIRVELDSTKVKMEGKQIVILDKVFFEVNKDIIKPESFKLLDEVASVIMANPQVGRVEVSGHTDSDGDDASNLDLSQRRSESVKRYLEGKGVKAERLVAKGYGESKPITENKTSKGKATNRRVEFNLIDQANPQGPIELPAKQGESIKPAGDK